MRLWANDSYIIADGLIFVFHTPETGKLKLENSQGVVPSRGKGAGRCGKRGEESLRAEQEESRCQGLNFTFLKKKKKMFKT